MNDTSEVSPSGEHRCPHMDHALSDERLPVTYWAKFREYGILYTDGSIQEIYFCPWCGVKLTNSVRDVWFNRIEEMGLELGDPRIPAAMLTEQWWKDEHR